MHDPRASVISSESDRNVVTGATDANHVSPDRASKVIPQAASAAHDAEGVLTKLC